MLEISVIIPVYNAEDSIVQAVESAVYIEVVCEIILVDDGSVDRSLELCRDLEQKYPKVRLFRHEDGKNHGAARSRNLGVKQSGCPYIAFLDADDYYLNNRFDRAHQIFIETPDADGVYDAVGVRNNSVSQSGEYDDMYTTEEYINPGDLFFNLSPIGKKGYFSIDGLTIKRQVFDSIGYFDTRLQICEDTLFFLKLSVYHVLYPGNIKEPTSVATRYKDTNLTNDKRRVIKFTILMYMKLFRWIQRDLKDEEKLLAAVDSYFRTMFYYWAYVAYKSYFIYLFRLRVLLVFLLNQPLFFKSRIVRKYFSLIRTKG